MIYRLTTLPKRERVKCRGGVCPNRATMLATLDTSTEYPELPRPKVQLYYFHHVDCLCASCAFSVARDYFSKSIWGKIRGIP